MTRIATILTAGLLALVLNGGAFAASASTDAQAVGQAGEDCCPTSANAPAMLAQADTGQLPQGHPPLDNADKQQALPPGHPPMGGSGGQLPPGHPPMGGALSPGTAIGKGTIIVKINQGTEGGDKAAGRNVQLKLVYQGRVINAKTAPVTKEGLAMFEQVGVTAPAIPIASIEYQGALYEAVGKNVSPQQPDQVISLPIYVPTETPPDWKITNRHLICQPMPGGLVVNDIMNISNPSDHAWLGDKLDPPPPPQPNAGHQHNHRTLAITLPHQAQRIQLAPEFSACCSTMVDDQVVHYGPLLPGTHAYRMVYILPIDKGKVTLPVTAAGPTDRLMIFLPDRNLKIKADGLSPGKPMDGQNMRILTYQAQSLKTGQTVSLAIEGLPTEPDNRSQANTQAIQTRHTPPAMKYLAAVGGGAILLFGSLFMLTRQSPAGHRSTPNQPS